MSNKQTEVRAMVEKKRKNVKKVINMLDNQKPVVILTPLQVITLSLSFFLMVFFMHLISKFFPSVSSSQIVISVMVLSISIVISMNKIS